MTMGIGSGGQGGPCPSWIFIHDSDKVKEGLMMLFFDIVIRCPPPLKIFLPTPLGMINSLRF